VRAARPWRSPKRPLHDPLELLTVERVAGLLCCSERYVYNQVKTGGLVGTRLGRSVKISRQNL